MKTKIDTWLGFEETNKWYEKIEEKNLDYYTDMYEAGQTKQKLVIGREVKGGGSVKMLFFRRLASVWTGIQNFTWFWFTPTSYKIVCTGATSTSWSDVLFSVWAKQPNGTTYASWQQGTASNYANNTWRVARVINNAGSTRTAFNHSAFISDGIALDCTDSWYDVMLEITAYK